MKMTNYNDAVEDCTKAIEIDPSYVKALLRRAQCYNQMEKYDECVRDYEKLCQLDSENNEYQRNLRDAKLNQKKKLEEKITIRY